MNSQLFLFINILAAILFTIWFLKGRKSKRNPVQLNLRTSKKEGGKIDSPSTQDQRVPADDIDQHHRERDVSPKLVGEKSAAANDIDMTRPLRPDQAMALASRAYHRKIPQRTSSSENRKSSGITNSSPNSNLSARDLSVVFIYNGHDWEAFKILGVPPGSSLIVVTEAYQQLIRKMDRDSLPFIEAAYRAILDSAKKRKVQ